MLPTVRDRHNPQGNLEWLAAFEVEPATQTIYLNCWKQEKTLTAEAGERRLRGAVTNAIQVVFSVDFPSPPRGLISRQYNGCDDSIAGLLTAGM